MINKFKASITNLDDSLMFSKGLLSGSEEGVLAMIVTMRF